MRAPTDPVARSTGGVARPGGRPPAARPAGAALLLGAALLAMAGAPSCASRRPAPGGGPGSTPRPSRVRVEGTVVLDRTLGPDVRTRGRLVLGRLTEHEARDASDGYLSLETILDMIPRLTVVGDVDVSRPVPFALEVPADRDAHLLALLDVSGELIPSLFGAGGEGNLMGVATEAYLASWDEPLARVELHLTHARHVEHEERCTGEHVELVRVEAPEVAGTAGNPTTRRLCVALPPSYASSPERRYPVVYVLPTLFGDDTVLFRYGHLPRVADRLARSLGREVIVVGVDSSTRFGASYYASSPLSGDFDAFLRERVLATIDTRYRTLARGDARALTGLSTGGFNAVSLALRYPETFGTVAAWSPDALDLSTYLFGAGHEAARIATAHNRAFMRLEDAVGGPGQMVSYAADWSPDPASARGFAWPIDLATGRANAHWERWLAASPSSYVADPARLDGIRRHLDDRIYIAAGRHDEFYYFDANRAFHERLRAAGVRHTFVAHDGGHADEPEQRVDGLLRYLLPRLRGAAP